MATETGIEGVILDLNSRGLQHPVEDNPGNFLMASQLLGDAVAKSFFYIDSINPDVFAFSAANYAEAIRHGRDHKVEAQDFLLRVVNASVASTGV